MLLTSNKLAPFVKMPPQGALKEQPEIEDRFSGALLVHKHILPVDHRERVEHRAEGLDRCEDKSQQVRAALAGLTGNWTPEARHGLQSQLF